MQSGHTASSTSQRCHSEGLAESCDIDWPWSLVQDRAGDVRGLVSQFYSDCSRQQFDACPIVMLQVEMLKHTVLSMEEGHLFCRRQRGCPNLRYPGVRAGLRALVLEGFQYTVSRLHMPV